MKISLLTTALGIGLALLAPKGQAADTAMIAGPNLIQARMNHNVSRLHDGRVIVFGGHGPGFVTLGTAELYSPNDNTWTSVPMLFPTTALPSLSWAMVACCWQEGPPVSVSRLTIRSNSTTRSVEPSRRPATPSVSEPPPEPHN